MQAIISLDGPWRLQAVAQFDSAYRALEYKDTDWISQTLPSQWQLSPQFEKYHGKMVYRKQFSFQKENSVVYDLRFEGVFYAASVYLNGKRLGQHEGYFSPFWFEVTAELQPENVLVVEVDSPNDVPASATRQVGGIFFHPRYVPANFNPGGIWRPVSIVPGDGFSVLYLRFKTLQCTPAQAQIEISVLLIAPQDQKVNINFNLSPKNFEGQPFQWTEIADLKKGRNSLRFRKNLEGAKLWWPYEIGLPDVYNATLQLLAGDTAVGPQVTRQVGIRTMTIERGRFRINGQSLFLRGASYLPTRAYLSQAGAEACEQDIRLAKEAHINCIRVRNHVSIPEFYDLCDTHGLLIWQDFPLWGIYPNQMATTIVSQLRRMFNFLGSHPAIAVWCCHDEPFPLISPDQSPWKKAKNFFGRYFFNWNKNVLDRRLRKELLQLDHDLVVVQSSGLWRLSGPFSDVHFNWYQTNLWVNRFPNLSRPFFMSREIVTDFGAESFSAIHSAHAESETKSVDLSGEETNSVESTQRRQAEVLRYFLEHLRIRKYRPVMGFFFAALNDLFERGGPGILDVNRQPKQAYEIVKMALIPLRLFSTDVLSKNYQLGDIDQISVLAVNDSSKPLAEGRALIKIKLERRPLLETTIMVHLDEDSLPVQVDSVYFRTQNIGVHHMQLSLKASDESGTIDALYDLAVMKAEL